MFNIIFVLCIENKTVRCEVIILLFAVEKLVVNLWLLIHVIHHSAYPDLCLTHLHHTFLIITRLSSSSLFLSLV